MPPISGGGQMTTCGKQVLSFHFVGSEGQARWQVLSDGAPSHWPQLGLVLGLLVTRKDKSFLL